VLEQDRARCRPEGLVPAPPVAPAPPTPALPRSSLPTIAILVLPTAAACATFAWTSSMPLDLHEQALVLTPDRLPRAARVLADILCSNAHLWRALGAVALGLAGIAAAALAGRPGRSPIAPLVAGVVVATQAAMMSS